MSETSLIGGLGKVKPHSISHIYEIISHKDDWERGPFWEISKCFMIAWSLPWRIDLLRAHSPWKMKWLCLHDDVINTANDLDGYMLSCGYRTTTMMTTTITITINTNNNKKEPSQKLLFSVLYSHFLQIFNVTAIRILICAISSLSIFDH